MNLKAVYEGGAFAFLKSGEMARPMPATTKAWKVVANCEGFFGGLNANYFYSIDLPFMRS